MRLPDIRTTRVKKVSTKGLPNISILPWSNEQMIIYTQSLEDLEDVSEDLKIPSILNLQYEQLVKPNIIGDEIPLSMLQKQLLMVEIYKISRGVRIALKYPCNDKKCEHVTKAYFNLNGDVIYKPISEKHRVINGYDFYLTENNYVTIDNESKSNQVKYLLGFIEKVKKDKIEFDFSIDEMYNWVMNELPDSMFNELLIYLEDNIPNVNMVQKITCEKCGSENVYTFEGIPDFSLGLLELI